MSALGIGPGLPLQQGLVAGLPGQTTYRPLTQGYSQAPCEPSLQAPRPDTHY